MASSTALTSPSNDYAAPVNAVLNKEFWDSALTSVGARIRALEALKVEWETLISQGTGQALAVIQANVEPQLVALTAMIDQLKADVAAAEDAIAVIVAGGVTMDNVTGLAAALALKANITYVDAAIDALKGGAPAAYDTLVEIAAKLEGDDTAIAGLLTLVAEKAAKATKIQVASGLSINGVAGSDGAPAEGDLSADRLLALNLAAKALASDVWAAGSDATEAPIAPAKLKAAVLSLSGGLATMQSVADVSASRAFGIVYHNTSGKTKYVSVNANSSGGSFSLGFSPTTSISAVKGTTIPTGGSSNLDLFVPPDWFYGVPVSSGITEWTWWEAE